jgi:hypothetical protein
MSTHRSRARSHPSGPPSSTSSADPQGGPQAPLTTDLEIGDRDPNLALVGLRLEIERRLNQILEAIWDDEVIEFVEKAPSENRRSQITRRKLKSLRYVYERKKAPIFTYFSMTEKIAILDEMKILAHEEASALRDLIPLSKPTGPWCVSGSAGL